MVKILPHDVLIALATHHVIASVNLISITFTKNTENHGPALGHILLDKRDTVANVVQ